MEKEELLLFEKKLVWLRQNNGFGLYLRILKIGDDFISAIDSNARNYVLEFSDIKTIRELSPREQERFLKKFHGGGE